MPRIVVCMILAAIACEVMFDPNVSAAGDKPILRKLSVDPDARRVGLFDALDEELVSIQVVPRNERESTVSITNNTESPLTVEVPKSVAAVHVLRQFQQPFAGPNSNNSNDPNAQQGSGQSVAGQMFGFPQQGQNNGQNFPFGNNFFSIPAEKTVQLKLQSVCLDHGNPTPTTRMKYELRRIETVARNSAVVEMITSADFRRGDREVIQAAAWNLSNNLTFEKLARQMSGIGVVRPQFTTQQLLLARKMVEEARTSADRTAKREMATPTQ